MLRRSITGAIAALALCSTSLLAQANGLTGPGTATYVRSQWGYFPCVGLQCTPVGGDAENRIAGNGSTLTYDQLTLIGEGDGQGMGYAEARSSLVGPLAAPKLQAKAGGVQGLGAPPGYSGTAGFFYGGDALANAVQYYSVQNPSAVPITFEVSYSFDAFLKASLPAELAKLSLNASLFVYDGLNANVEMPFGSMLAGDYASFSGLDAVGGRIDEMRTLSFTVQPGSGFYVLAAFSAGLSGYPEGDNEVDAMSTFTVSFEGANASLLRARLPATTPVPEPESWALTLAGLGVLCLVRRSRDRREVTRR
ncbi:PEP-CTERM sorting domain-containing protein [Gemmatimonas sp.]